MKPAVARLIHTFGRLYNGYEIEGAEHIPDSSGAIFVTYHAPMPIDGLYFMAEYYRRHFERRGRHFYAAGDRILFRVPPVRALARSLSVIQGDYDSIREVLRAGHFVGLMPGGMREAIKGNDKRYQLLWGGRLGFARLAIETGAPLIAGFSTNGDDIFRTPFSGARPLQWVYDHSRVPLVAWVGPFPVRVRTILAPPIHPRPGEPAERLRDRVKETLSGLIATHQRSRGLGESLAERARA